MTASAIAVHTDAKQERQAAGRPGVQLGRPLRPRRPCCASASFRGSSRADPDDYSDGNGGIDPASGLGAC